jgi:hypothetical protein
VEHAMVLYWIHTADKYRFALKLHCNAWSSKDEEGPT